MRRRDVLGLLTAAALPCPAQSKRLFEVVAVNHINIRASNPTRSAHFYQSLFGGGLRWIESIPPNPTSPAAESWYLSLGRQYLSISPAFPNLSLGPGLDHICPAIRGYQEPAATTQLKERGIEVASAGGAWIRDPSGTLFQFRNDAGADQPAAPPAQAKPKADDTAGSSTAPFTALAIREITIRVDDLAKAVAFYASVFGGEVNGSARGDSRSFQFGDTVVRLLLRRTSDSAGMDHFTVAIKDFSADQAARILRGRALKAFDNGRPGEVHFSDPDSIQVQLT